MRFRITTLLAAIALCAMPASAQNVEDDPGYVDLRRFERSIDAEPTLEVNLRGALLRMVAEAARFDDDALAQLLDRIRGIYVRGYTFDREDADRVRDPFTEMSNTLRDGGWMNIVRVRERDEQVDVLVRETGDHIDGLAVLVVGTGTHETVLVNIVGEIRPEELGRIGRRFAIDALEDL